MTFSEGTVDLNIHKTGHLTLFWMGPECPCNSQEGEGKMPAQFSSAIWHLTTMKPGRNRV